MHSMDGLISSLMPEHLTPPAWGSGEKTLNHSQSEAASTEAPRSPGASTPMTPQVGGNSQYLSTSELANCSDPRTWDANTLATLTHAKGYGAKMDWQLIKNESLEMDNTHAVAVKEHLLDKMAANRDLIRVLEFQMSSVDDTVREVNHLISFLKRALRTKWAPLCIVLKRLKIRENRPVQERTYDTWQRAMEEEVEVLVSTREEIAEIIEETKTLIPPLEQVKGIMFVDLNNKRRTTRVDHNCLLEGHGRGIPRSEECIFEPLAHALHAKRPSHPVHDDALDGIGIHNEAAWREQIEKTRATVARLIAVTREKLQVSKEAVLEKEQRCVEATAQTVAIMNKHVAKLAASKVPFEEMIDELEKIAYTGDIGFRRATKKLNQHAAPLRTTQRQMVLRQERCDEEHIRDQADERLDAHMMAVKQFVEALTPHVEWTAELVDNVRATKRSLQQALDIRVRTLRVDMQCVKPKQEWINEAATREVRQS